MGQNEEEKSKETEVEQVTERRTEFWNETMEREREMKKVEKRDTL